MENRTSTDVMTFPLFFAVQLFLVENRTSGWQAKKTSEKGRWGEKF